MEETIQLHFNSREEWREWLSQYNETADGIWLVYFKKHTGKPTVTQDKFGG
ncbi:MAG: hypothetical protein K9H13_07740 [Bacteroidales bacterium]|nr:hypothetical protein [Bacteroidales bacterium]MCF8350778.1 hypothetical protein [Bacteroidales bacterium]